MFPHKSAAFVTVSDEREGDALRHFTGVRSGPQPEGDATVTVFVICDDADNGFGWPVSGVVAELKHLGDNKYGA